MHRGGGNDIVIQRSEIYKIEKLESQKALKKRIYGKGFLVSDELGDKILEARRAVEAQRAQRTIIWELSEKEKEIIRKLSPKID